MGRLGMLAMAGVLGTEYRASYSIRSPEVPSNARAVQFGPEYFAHCCTIFSLATIDGSTRKDDITCIPNYFCTECTFWEIARLPNYKDRYLTKVPTVPVAPSHLPTSPAKPSYLQSTNSVFPIRDDMFMRHVQHPGLTREMVRVAIPAKFS